MFVRGVRPKADERGAVAIMVAIMAVLLVSMAALAVDLGNAYVHKHDIQKRTDFAALAGGAGDSLPKELVGSPNCSSGSHSWISASASDQAIIDAAEYLSKEQATSVPPGDLADCDLTNGEANYGTWKKEPDGYSFLPNENQLSVISPPDRVDFGLAAVMGFNSVDVAGQATVEIKTQLMKTLPMYAVDGCDYGLQTLQQPTNGHSSVGVYLDDGAQANYDITETSLLVDPASTTTPPTVQLNSTTTVIKLSGTKLDKVKQVGFFRSAAPPLTPPEPVIVEKAPAIGGFTVTDTDLITVTVPTAVTGVQDVWFIRLYGPNGKGNPGPDEWTAVERKDNSNKLTNLAALPITVGNATLSCDQGSSSGNFGTLDLFNGSSDAPNGQAENIAYNIAYGLQFGLAPYPEDKLTPLNDYQCTDGQDGVAQTWPGDGTNCVGTKTGYMDASAAEKGFVTGVGTPNKAILKDPKADEFCPRDLPNSSHTTVAPTGTTINNDVLTCFFLSDDVTVADVSGETYPSTLDGPVIDQAIYDSPRFVLVPVLGGGPKQGSSNNYEIVDFRPGFITDQAGTESRMTNARSTNNGLVWSASNKLQAVKIVFLNPQALPDPPLDPDGKYIPYVGSGKKSLLLVD